MPMGIVLRDRHGVVIDCNEQAATILEVPRDKILDDTLAGPLWSIVREGSTPFPLDEEPWQVTLRTGRPRSDVVMGVSYSGRSHRWVINSCARAVLEDESIGVISAFFDITPSIKSRRILKLIAEANRIVITSKDEHECLEEFCDALVNLGGYHLASIGPRTAREDDPNDLVFTAGTSEFLRETSSQWWEVPGDALSSPLPSISEARVVDDLANHSWSATDQSLARDFAVGSSAAIPFDLNGREFVVAVYDEFTHSFDDTTVVGLQQIVNEIEFGLVHIQSIHHTEQTLDELTVANNALQVAEQTLAKSEKWFRELLASSRDLIVVLDDQARVLYANPANAATSGFDETTRLGGDGFTHIHPDDYELAFKTFGETLARTGDGEPIVVRFLKANGEWQFLECVLANCMDEPAIQGIVVNARDVTERIHLTRALRTLTNGSQVLVSAPDEKTLIQQTCQTIVTSGDFVLAWVGFINDDDNKVVLAGAAGRTAYLENIDVTWDEASTGRGPTGTAIRTGAAQVLADIQKSDWPQAGKTRTAEFGFKTVCSFPLRIGSRVIGALTIFSAEEGVFAPAELSLLGELAGYLGYGIGRIRDAKRLEGNAELLRESELRFRLAFESNMAPMVFSDVNDIALSANDAFCRMVGYSQEEIVGRDSVHFTYPPDVGVTEHTISRLNANEVDQLRYTKRYLRKDGRLIISEVSRSAARDATGQTLYFVSSEREVTEERALAEQLTHQALHDPLTGLANRVLFEDRLIQAHARVVRQGGFAAVLLLDLDDFSHVNDSHGHLVGDQLLVQMARRFQSVTRSSDTLGRFGGDEFLYLAEGLESRAEAESVAVRLLDVLNSPFSLDELHFEQRASVGVAIWDATSDGTKDLIQNADVALYEAKHGGKGRFMIFTPRMHKEAIGRFTLVQALRLALHAGQLAMHYQPVVDLASSEIVGFEALMRWPHVERGWVPPNVFIPLAEQSELIFELGTFALSEAIAAAATWRPVRPGTPAPYVTVNLSARQFQDPQLFSKIEGILSANNFPPERLIIEITESVTLFDTAETMSIVNQLNEHGVAIALDDFGTGYSSLSYLVRLRPRLIKIDQYFVSPHSGSSYDDVLLEAIVSLGNKLHMTMLAEGIEEREQLERLRAMNCQLGQGYLFSPAVPAADVPAMIERGFSLDEFATTPVS
ncbi:MAG TPA: EAL domain-containing protein [Acidimicrobiales bacterium]